MAASVNPESALPTIERSPLHAISSEEELRTLLRSRLLLVNGLFLTPMLIVIVIAHFDPIGRADTTLAGYFFLYGLASVFFAFLVGLVLRPQASLTTLRVIESCLFGAATLGLLLDQYLWLGTGWLEGVAVAGQERKLMQIAADSLSVPWMVLIIMYGIAIPNTGPRTALVVSVMVAVALASCAIVGGHIGDLGFYLLRVGMNKVLLFLLIAAIFAIYGARRLHALRVEASAARRLGPYELKRRLGAGGMGEVYLAAHQLLRRPCAVKLIRPDQAGDPGALRRFGREVQSTAALTHPNVVEIYDYGQTHDGIFYYVMEYLPGPTLQDLVRRYGAVPPARAVHFLLQIAGALREAHSVGLVHRDIKPGNIILCERGRVPDVVKLLDFGLVQDRQGAWESPPALAQNLGAASGSNPGDPTTRAGTVVGTPAFMAPEQIAGTRQLDGRSDLYSLGVVAYWLMAGHNPFHRATSAATVAPP